MAVVLVIGASRGIGLETVRRALAAGHRVRALARGAASIPIDEAGLEKVAGDALDRAAVTASLKGADAVIETLGAPKDLAATLWGTRLFSDATRILVDAMRERGRPAPGGRHRPGRRRQSRPRRPALRRHRLSARAQAHLRRQGRAGADDPGKRPRLDHRPPRPAAERPRHRPRPRLDRSEGLECRVA